MMDTAQIGDLYKKYKAPLKKFLKNRFPKMDHDEIIQETFFKLLKGRANYDSKRPIKPYLYAISLNAAATQWHNLERWQNTYSSWEQPQPNPEQSTQYRELSNLLARARKRLPKKERIYFDFRCIDGHTQVQTACHMGVSRTMVRRLQTKTQQRFSQIFKTYGYGELANDQNTGNND